MSNGRTDGQMYCMYLKCSPHATTDRFLALVLLIDEVSHPVLLVVLASSKALGDGSLLLVALQ